MTNSATEAERALFVQWMRSRPGYPFAGAYANLMWEAWQAARAIPQAAAEPVIRAIREACDIAMRHCIEARVPECGHFGEIAQDLSWALDQLAAPDRAPSIDSATTGHAVLDKQVADWRKEVARLNDLISTATGASIDSATETPVTAGGKQYGLPHGWVARKEQDGTIVVYGPEGGVSIPNKEGPPWPSRVLYALVNDLFQMRPDSATERDAARYRFMRDDATGRFIQFIPYGKPIEIDAAVDRAIAAMKGEA